MGMFQDETLIFLMNQVVSHTDARTHKPSECDSPESCSDLDLPH
jgi:hypothetical protein